jgi:hypothetical protein
MNAWGLGKESRSLTLSVFETGKNESLESHHIDTKLLTKPVARRALLKRSVFSKIPESFFRC